jgi:hypothetical protein
MTYFCFNTVRCSVLRDEALATESCWYNTISALDEMLINKPIWRHKDGSTIARLLIDRVVTCHEEILASLKDEMKDE